jgi:hypothetical protein
MHKKSFLLVFILLTAFLSHAQQTGLYPLTQYSVGGTSPNVQLRTTAITQNDTLKIPYIEDFSGPGIPIDSISVDEVATTPSVLAYRVTFLKMHGLKSGDSIRIYNATGGIATSAAVNGDKYVKVIDKYSFQLFNNSSMTLPALVLAGRLTYFNWHRIGVQGYSSSPDTLGFLANNGGVFINTDMALNPISIGVASFDGVDYRGIPYSTTPSKGYADNLTSLPFNLSMYQPKDSIYMSFYWQSKSLGESPIANEFLCLDFKDTSGTWVEQVWKQEGASVTQDTFKIAVVAIRDSAYLHKGFQYRFRSYGVLNGRFNVWNLDYIYINSKRDPARPELKDVSIITTHRNALKNYTSIPYKHIQNLSIATLTDETGNAFMRIRDQLNIYPLPPTPRYAIERRHLIRDNLDNNSIKFYSQPSFDQQSPVFIQPLKDTIPRDYMIEPYSLKEEFYYQPLDTLDRIDLTFNNFTTIETYFTDYYSYDDGTPEVAFLSINPGGTKVANKYNILKADVLTHIDYCFIRNNGVDMTNAVIYLNVWERESPPLTTPVKLKALTQQQISIRYSSEINGFVRYALNTPLSLNAGEYYFGYTQNALNPLYLGYDRNNDHLDKITFSNNGVTWQPFSDNTQITGSLMIRPVFSKNEVITSVTDTYTGQNQFTFYPNPAKSELHFTGHPEYISVYDLSGLLMVEKQVEDGETLSVETISNGLYLMILSKGNYKEVKRLIIQK